MHSRPYVRELVLSGLAYNELTMPTEGFNLLIDEIMEAYFESKTRLPVARIVRDYLNHIASELTTHPEYEADLEKNKYQFIRVK